MIYIELLRYFFRDSQSIKNTFDVYFKSYCDSREKEPNALIVTHIFLLIGCALPPTLSFIILNGGFMNKIFELFALSGLVFLGIGDTTVI